VFNSRKRKVERHVCLPDRMALGLNDENILNRSPSSYNTHIYIHIYTYSARCGNACIILYYICQTNDLKVVSCDYALQYTFTTKVVYAKLNRGPGIQNEQNRFQDAVMSLYLYRCWVYRYKRWTDHSRHTARDGR